ncbi:outer membrane beta-barrel protein [Arenimonas oryziterrae]|uniref:Outer membrane protein beta-barrel domain-containing protein n=1 Tax=Arenimonas oryziterrae DSM 21050 = YC6267 TaxID=1121015 RepID=A0A091ALR9_9GAMM|nr:outer membrane beta-barrel protein [Arenimonas oryziterrae]KFN41138.1 hypothetical protein N789_04430 [Arenimonas oryziterrae DSM 21050 = YC6267]
MINHKKLTLSVFAALGLSLAASSASAANSHFYGSLEAGVQNADDSAIPFSMDYPSLRTRTTDYGSGRNVGLTLGYRFDNPLFIELSVSRDSLTNTTVQTDTRAIPAPPCGVPFEAAIPYCLASASLATRVDHNNVDLVAGWGFKATETVTFSPYAGVRRMKLQDERKINNVPLGAPFTDRGVDISSFNEYGFLIGVRYDQEFKSFYLTGDLQHAQASGDRVRGYHSALVDNTGATLIAVDHGITEDISVRQQALSFGIGHRFVFGGQPATINLSYQVQRGNGYDTRIDTIAPSMAASFGGNRGVRNESVTTQGFMLSFGINN